MAETRDDQYSHQEAEQRLQAALARGCKAPHTEKGYTPETAAQPRKAKASGPKSASPSTRTETQNAKAASLTSRAVTVGSCGEAVLDQLCLCPRRQVSVWPGLGILAGLL